MFNVCIQRVLAHAVAPSDPWPRRVPGGSLGLPGQQLSVSTGCRGRRFQQMGVVFLIVNRPHRGRGVALARINHKERQQRSGGKEAAKR